MKISPLASFYFISLTTLCVLVSGHQSSSRPQDESTSTANKSDSFGTSLFSKILMRPTLPAANKSLSNSIESQSAGPKSSIESGEEAKGVEEAANEDEDENEEGDQAENDDDDDDDDEEEEEEEDEDEEVDDKDNEVGDGGRKLTNTEAIKRMLEDMRHNPNITDAQSKARDLGLLTLKAILLGPLIGLTIKAALIRGLLWAVGAYLLHLFFPGILGALGLGSGLVGFARQMHPNYPQMLMPLLIELENSLPAPVTQAITQCRQAVQPLLKSAPMNKTE